MRAASGWVFLQKVREGKETFLCELCRLSIDRKSEGVIKVGCVFFARVKIQLGEKFESAGILDPT